MKRVFVGFTLPPVVWMVASASPVQHAETNLGIVEYTLGWSDVDCGGAVLCAGGDFSLSGTVGLPGNAVLTGGVFSVSGGFSVPTPPGDCNTDGGIDLKDYDSFGTCLLGPRDGVVAADCGCFDLDQSETIDLRDFGQIQQRFGGS